jgi:SNF2 family DNA or RNA helicase
VVQEPKEEYKTLAWQEDAMARMTDTALEHQRGMIQADEQGLGKTHQMARVLLQLLLLESTDSFCEGKESKDSARGGGGEGGGRGEGKGKDAWAHVRQLIVVPKSVVGNWHREGLKVCLLLLPDRRRHSCHVMHRRFNT